MTTAIIYTRFSPRPNAQECDSCERQEERCRAYCERKGYRIWDMYSDPKVSGGQLDRPELAVAIEKIGHCDCNAVLVVDSADRLARDMLVSLMIRHEVEKAGGRIEYANGTPVNDTPEGRLFTNILAAFASYERDRVRFATSRGMKRRQENGEWFGRPPVGWMRDPECSTRLIECPREQRALTTARIMRLETTFSWNEIASELQDRFGSFRSGPWKPDTIRKALAKEES